MPTLESKNIEYAVHELELLSEQGARVAETIRRKELEVMGDRLEERFTSVKRAYMLTYIAFHYGIPMDMVSKMVVARSGVYVKGAPNVRPIPINSRGRERTARKRGRKASSE